LSGEWILVVDDGKENRDFVAENILQPNGYQPLIARDGQEGLEMALKHRPDLILLDLQMPRLNGIQVIQALAEHNADIPIILMTFHGSEEIAIEVHRLGVRDYLKKPFTIDEMLIAIERSLNEIRLRREKEALTERVLTANREMQKRLQEMNVLYTIGRQVAALTSMDELMPRVVGAAVQITQAEEGFLYLVNGETQVLHLRALLEKGKQTPESMNQLNVDNPLANHVAKNAQPLILTPEQLTGRNPRGLYSVAYNPIVVGKRVIGVLGVGNLTHESHIFSKHDSALLSTLTDYAGIAIENARNYEELRSTKEMEKAKIRDTFERFVPPTVVKSAIDDNQEVKLGGQKREITVLFADIRGYTTWSENEPPERIVEMLNDYLSLAAEVILGWEGTLDKFLGDGLMAFFNAPNDQEDHVHRAVDAALALIKAAEEVSKWRNYNLSYSIGVHVGEAVVGYIGTDRALNYTAIGDAVNVAKRLQEVAQGGQIVVEESLINKLGDEVQGRQMGKIRLRGRRSEVVVYELIGLKPK
jgi:adenylate cyclase